MQYVFVISKEFENLEKDSIYIGIAKKIDLPL